MKESWVILTANREIIEFLWKEFHNHTR